MGKYHLILSIFLVGSSFGGCSGKPSEKEIISTIHETLSCCDLEDHFKTEISGVSQDAENLITVMAKISIDESLPRFISVDPTGTYKFTLKKYDKGWLIEKTEPQWKVSPGSVDVYGLVAFLNRECDAIRLGMAKGALSAVRSALQVYYGDNEGWFPTDLKKAVIPNYLSGIPAIKIGGKPKTDSVVYTDAWDGECGGVTNSGGWLYGRNPINNKVWGNIVIDSDGLSPEGRKWCSY